MCYIFLSVDSNFSSYILYTLVYQVSDLRGYYLNTIYFKKI